MKEIETINESNDAIKTIQVITPGEKTKENIELIRPVQEISLEENRIKYCMKKYCRMDKVFYQFTYNFIIDFCFACVYNFINVQFILN